MYTLIVTAKINYIDPRYWIADMLARLPNAKVSRMPELLQWSWKPATTAPRKAA